MSDLDKARVKELERALSEIRDIVRLEQEHPPHSPWTAINLGDIERKATLALAGCDTYEMETEG